MESVSLPARPPAALAGGPDVPEPRFCHHFASLDLPSDRGQGDDGPTAPTNLDGDGDVDIVSRPRSAAPTNGDGGRIHVHFLEGLATP